MVEIHYNLHRSNLLDCTEDWRTVGTHHLDHVTRVDVGRVELAVDSEYLAVEILHMVRVLLAIGIGKRECEIEVVTFLEVLEVLLE